MYTHSGSLPIIITICLVNIVTNTLQEGKTGFWEPPREYF